MSVVSITALMANKNNDPKAHCVYTTKYTKTISWTKIVAIIRLQPNVQVLSRGPPIFPVRVIIVNMSYILLLSWINEKLVIISLFISLYKAF